MDQCPDWRTPCGRCCLQFMTFRVDFPADSLPAALLHPRSLALHVSSHTVPSHGGDGEVQLGVQGSPTLLSSMTVLRDSIHMGSMSPSRTIHLGPSCVMLARSRMMVENRPVRRQAGDMHGHVRGAKWHDGCSGAFKGSCPGGSDFGLARSHFLRGGWSPFKGTTVAFFLLVVLPTPLPLPSSDPPIPLHC